MDVFLFIFPFPGRLVNGRREKLVCSKHSDCLDCFPKQAVFVRTGVCNWHKLYGSAVKDREQLNAIGYTEKA